MPVEQNGMIIAPRHCQLRLPARAQIASGWHKSVAVLPDQRYVLIIWRTREEHSDALDALVEFQRALAEASEL